MVNKIHLADVFEQHLHTYQQNHVLTYQQAKVCQHIHDCRTASLGQQLWSCDHCHHEHVCYCSCRDRHCPRCQWKQTQEWIDKQREQVVDSRYFHLVFTLPHELNIIAHYRPKDLYDALFESVWKTLSKFGSNRKQLQGQLGCTAVLHTWGQTLTQHIHLHCLIPGGAFTQQGKWNAVNKDYLFPVKALSTVFRAKMIAALRQRNVDIPAVETLLSKSWVVFSKACLTKPETIIQYLGRYTRKGMFQESRIKTLTDESISFSYTDYQHNNAKKIMRLEGEEFVRRYLLHVLPKGMMRIRHLGFLANACRQKKLKVIREQQCSSNRKVEKCPPTTHSTQWLCPECKKGELKFRGLVKTKYDKAVCNRLVHDELRLSG